MSLDLTNIQRAEWLAWRRTGITATDAPAIVGLSNYGSAYSVWASKMMTDDGPLIPDDDRAATDAMKFGKYMEPGLALWFQDEHPGLFVSGEQMWCTHPVDRWRIATIDGAVTETPNGDIDGALGGFEIKTTGDSAAEWDEQIPWYVQAQVQWQMAVTGLPRTFLATLHRSFGFEFKVRVIERDDTDIAMLVDAARTLWFDHVCTGIAPPTDSSHATTAALRAAYPEHLEGETADITELADLLASRVHCKADEKNIKERLAEIDNRLAAALGTAETGLVDGEPAVTYRSQTRTTTCKVCDHSTTSDPFRVLRTVKPKSNKKAA